MDINETVLYIVAAFALGFALYNMGCFIIKGKNTARTTGTIISLTSPNPSTAKARNSKWAQISYTVNGKSYTSENRVQVPMSSEVGGSISIRYDLDIPTKLYSFSLSRILIAVFIAGICIIAAIFNLI